MPSSSYWWRNYSVCASIRRTNQNVHLANAAYNRLHSLHATPKCLTVSKSVMFVCQCAKYATCNIRVYICVWDYLVVSPHCASRLESAQAFLHLKQPGPHLETQSPTPPPACPPAFQREYAVGSRWHDRHRLVMPRLTSLRGLRFAMLSATTTSRHVM